MLNAMNWRPMQREHLPRVVDIANNHVHLDYPENPEVFSERLRLFPRGCYVLKNPQGEVSGYFLSHPWGKKPPKLDAPLRHLPRYPQTYYIHDIAILKETRRRGSGSKIVKQMLRCAHHMGLPNASLISVSGSSPFWAKHRFKTVNNSKYARSLARSYGSDSQLMVYKF